MDVALRSLPLLFFLLFLHSKQHFDVNDLVKVPGESIKLGGHIGAQGGGDFEVVTADRQVHEEPPVALGVEKAVLFANGRVSLSLTENHYAPDAPEMQSRADPVA
jgi:hypothetical protein